MKNLNGLIRFIDCISAELSERGSCSLPAVMEFSKADLLERWEAILLDKEFPDRKRQSDTIQYILKQISAHE